MGGAPPPSSRVSELRGPGSPTANPVNTLLTWSGSAQHAKLHLCTMQTEDSGRQGGVLGTLYHSGCLSNKPHTRQHLNMPFVVRARVCNSMRFNPIVMSESCCFNSLLTHMVDRCAMLAACAPFVPKHARWQPTKEALVRLADQIYLRGALYQDFPSPAKYSSETLSARNLVSA